MELHSVFGSAPQALPSWGRWRGGQQCCVLLPDISAASSLDGFAGAVSL